MANQFTRTEMMFGKSGMERLFKSRVAVFGIGGVGGYVVEALVRTGVGAVDIIDNDIVSLTNINRQIYATHSTVGLNKVDVAEQRIKDINPNCAVRKYNLFFSSETADKFNFAEYDYIVDAIDTVTGKIALAECANAVNTPIISSMGAGNKLNPCAFEVADIYKTSVCPLAKVMRRELKKRNITSLKVVYSKEEPITPLCNEGQEISRKPIPSSNAFVPSVAGLIIASEVIKDLIG